MKNLADLKKSELEEYEFPGTDAAILKVEQKIEQSELETLWEDYTSQHRFYKTEKGWNIKFPYWDVVEICEQDDSLDINDYEREVKGWGHEHCSFCHEHIWIGDTSYTHDHEDGGVYIICTKCYQQTK
jgi:hypothetical protein